MKTLVLITSNFPFDKGEPFIAGELQFLIRNFARIIIIAQNISGEKTRDVQENISVYRYDTSTSLSGFLYLPVLFILNSGRIISMLREEIEFRLSNAKGLTIRNFINLFRKIIKSVQLRDFINKKLLGEGINESIVFYSYWLKTGAHAIAQMNYPNSIKIARAHGSDLYEEKTASGYLPLVWFSALNLDAIFFVSKHGKQYFEESIKTGSSRFIVSYLGSEMKTIEYTNRANPGKYIIVSCSNLVPLKRIDLIIEALAVVESDKDILWLHFGDGVLRNTLERIAEEKLSGLNRIGYKFMGHYPNEELLNYYSRNKVDLFINTSSTEGLPVSIMEAQSFGIPVIATDTGGVRELVTEGTGTLLPIDFRPEDLSEKIRYYADMNEDLVNLVRMNALNNWKLNFNASSNYEDFISKVNSILATGKEQNQQF
jgi:colanic acid/amylovoran biosynthesis glycosyltransferase